MFMDTFSAIIFVDPSSQFFSGLQFKTDQGQHVLKNPLVITSLIDKVCFDMVPAVEMADSTL